MRNQDLKRDGGKIRMELIPPRALEGVAEVLTFGAQKYEAESWRQVEVDRYIGAALRHLSAIMRGEKYDPETGLLHADHLACNAMFIRELGGVYNVDNK